MTDQHAKVTVGEVAAVLTAMTETFRSDSAEKHRKAVEEALDRFPVRPKLSEFHSLVLYPHQDELSAVIKGLLARECFTPTGRPAGVTLLSDSFRP